MWSRTVAASERTMSASEFKAKCLGVMDELAGGTLARVAITKRGRTVAIMTAAGPAPRLDRSSLFGFMKGWPSPVPPGHDWEKPLYSDEELDGFLAETERQIWGDDERANDAA